MRDGPANIFVTLSKAQVSATLVARRPYHNIFYLLIFKTNTKLFSDVFQKLKSTLVTLSGAQNLNPPVARLPRNDRKGV
jgi:primosomal protein N''